MTETIEIKGVTVYKITKSGGKPYANGTYVKYYVPGVGEVKEIAPGVWQEIAALST
jgi:hypothetical protein